jgi:GPI mannosyltransferase 3
MSVVDAQREQPSTSRPPWRWLAVVAVLPLLDAVFRMGRLHPDEIYQALDPAMSRAFGFGVMAWEWQSGLRNWFIPGLFSLLLRACEAIGVTDVQGRRFVLALPQAGLHLAMLGAVWRFSARRLSHAAAHPSTASRFAVLLIALNPLVIFFAGRTMSESFSAALLVWGLERLDDVDDHRWHVGFLGGVLLGLAEVTRYGSAAVIVPALVVLAATRRFRVLALCVVGGALVALGLGLLDRLTWGATLPSARLGGWWHSLLEYVDYNIISGKSASFGTSPWFFYLPRLLFAPVGLLGLALWRWDKAARAWLFAVPALVYVISISITPHKEDRFLYPALVLLCVAAAPAVARAAITGVPLAPRWLSGRIGRALAGVAVIASLAVLVVTSELKPTRPELFRLTTRASREGTGLIVMNEGLWGAGGAFFMNGSNVFFRSQEPRPTSTRWWCTCDFPEEACLQVAAQTALLNRAIFMDPHDPPRTERSLKAFEALGFSVVDKDGDGFYLVRGAPP